MRTKGLPVMPSYDSEKPDARATWAEMVVAADPEQVWQAIATGFGTVAWLFPAEIEGREGGAVRIDRRPYDEVAAATVTAWDPPYRFAYEESVRDANGSTAPLATEFLVEARQGGSCVVRVVSGVFDDGDGWEDLVEGTGAGWRMSMPILACYLTNFAGMTSSNLNLISMTGRSVLDRAGVAAELKDSLRLTGLTEGTPFRMPDDAPPLAGVVEHSDQDSVLLRADHPGPALLTFAGTSMDETTAVVTIKGHFYGPDRASLAEREQRNWNTWLANRFPSADRQ